MNSSRWIRLLIAIGLAVVAVPPSVLRTTQALAGEQIVATSLGPSQFDVAMRWAPIHYQDTDSTNPRADYLAAFSFDSNVNAVDNWDNLDSWLQFAHVYYSVAETCTHWFISYTFFHPRDWSDGRLIKAELDPYGFVVDEGQEHENDMEDSLVIVRKDGSSSGRIEAVLTQAHGNYLSWLPAGSPLIAASGQEVHGTLPLAEYPVGSGALHPETAQQAKGHGVGAKGGIGNFAGERDKDGIIYFPTGSAEAPTPGAREVGYGLISYLDVGGLWDIQLAEDLIPQEDAETYFTGKPFGTLRGDESGGCGGSVNTTCVTNSAGPPWGQDDDGEDAPRGAAVLDPADLVRYYFVGFDDFDFEYVANDYIAELRDARYGPQGDDGTIRTPRNYEGPALTSAYFAKLLGADGDADGVHSCDERAAGTDPRKADSDDDGVDDLNDAFPLDPLESRDTDGDGLGDNADADDDGDGVADADDAFPLDATESVDTDGDGVGNNADTDDDNDGLEDATENMYGTNPVDADSDADGLADGRDVEFIQNAVQGVPLAAFVPPSGATRTAFLIRLDQIETAILHDDDRTIVMLRDLRRRVDGCGGQPDPNDWIRQCGPQTTIRTLLNLLIDNLTG